MLGSEDELGEKPTFNSKCTTFTIHLTTLQTAVEN
jgi:hypothetical protein